MRLIKQITLIISVILCFTLFNTSIYFLCTQRCLPDNGQVEKIKIISLEKYLPFDEKSEIVNIKAELPLTGELPVIDGAEGLYPVFSAVVNALYPENSVSFNGQNFDFESKLQMNNTLKAYKGVVDGTADLVFCAGPSQAQLNYAAENDVELEFVPIGKEAFVFLVNSKNPIRELTAEEIRGIYTGQYTNWSQLGGKNIPISALQRIEGSGSQTAFLAFMNGEKAIRDYDSFIGSAIGFSFRYYVADVIENSGVKMLAVNGAYPDRENIKNGRYPIVSQFYAVYDKENDNPNIPILIEWLLSEEGQYIIEKTGYTAIK